MAIHHCAICTRDFANEAALEMHTRSSLSHRNKVGKQQVHALAIGLTRKPTEAFTTSSSERRPSTAFKSHFATTPSKSSVLHCDTCRRGFITEEALQMHIKTSKSHKRELSVQKLITQAEAKALSPSVHGIRNTPIVGPSVNHVEPSITSLYCEICSRQFNKEGGLQAHLRTSKDHKETLKRLQTSKYCQELVNVSPPALSDFVPELQNTGTAQNVVALIQPSNTKVNCVLCEREFKTAKALQLHVENSKIHRKEVKLQRKQAEKSGTPISGTISSTIQYGHGSYKQAGESKNVLASAFIALQPQAPDHRIYTEPQSSYLQQADSVMAGISKRQILLDADKEIVRSGQNGGSCWSAISVSKQLIELEILRENCHSPDRLQDHKYILRPYGPDDVAGLRKCVNCGGMFSLTHLVSVKTKMIQRCTKTSNIEPKANVSFILEVDTKYVMLQTYDFLHLF